SVRIRTDAGCGTSAWLEAGADTRNRRQRGGDARSVVQGRQGPVFGRRQYRDLCSRSGRGPRLLTGAGGSRRSTGHRLERGHQLEAGERLHFIHRTQIAALPSQYQLERDEIRSDCYREGGALPLPCLRGRAGVGVSARINYAAPLERALTRRFAPTSPASGRGEVNLRQTQPYFQADLSTSQRWPWNSLASASTEPLSSLGSVSSSSVDSSIRLSLGPAVSSAVEITGLLIHSINRSEVPGRSAAT